ncbi:MAG: hypothetical protein BWK76_01400 [Desulfobulbaceae bacterium A2]|nr:MAG: hypothetical protein BWK76_01400 [Desulfobulbaceae bacterium A2]
MSAGTRRFGKAFFPYIERAPLDLRALLLLTLALLVVSAPLANRLVRSVSSAMEDDGTRDISRSRDGVTTQSVVRTRLFVHQPLPVNQADRATLTLIPGIGPKLAEAIVCRRTESGAFGQAEDLLHVRGIGREHLHRIQPWLSFE